MLAETTNSTALIQRLLDSDVFPHPITEIELLETHISWVILTGDYAYKIKKPVKFDFVDYSSLEKRKRYCDLEIELNRRFAADIYLGVAPIIEADGQLKVLDENALTDRSESAIEFAVKMRQFRQDSIAATRLQNPELTAAAVEDFASYLAGFHAAIESAIPAMDCVQPDRIAKDAQDNFPVLKDVLFGDAQRLSSLERLERWTADYAGRLNLKFKQRLINGNVRLCHGDLHLKNIVQLNGDLVAFDGIEFNEEFQWIDVLSEIAFPVMDFVARDRTDLAWRLLNSYLEATGDYLDSDILRFYLVYRAMVRAKVTCLNPKNKDPEIRKQYATGNESTDQFAGPWDKYLKTAAYFAFDLTPRLAITHGFSGSGKSTVAMDVIEADGGIRIRSDVERHRLASQFKVREEYSSDMDEWTYSCLLKLAISVLDSGFPVVIDATFLSLARRTPFLQLAQRESLDFEILECDAPFEELCDRIRKRGSDPSDATIDVLKMQMASHDPLTTDELVFVRRVSTS